MRQPFGIIVLFTVTLVAGVHASVLQWDGPKIFEQSVSRDLQISDHSEIELDVGELFEDDGPASGHSYKHPENREQLSSQIWLKKELLIPNPQARAAHLVVLSEEPFEALINGIPQKLGENQSGRKLHQSYAFDPNLLQAGRNEIILRTSGKVMIARGDEFALGSRTRTQAPHRSARSTDAGKTWDYEHLGPEGKLQGEYGVRVYLDHYRLQGSLTLPVLDIGNLEGKAWGSPLVGPGPVKIAVDADIGRAGHLVVRVRTGASYVPSPKLWSTWETLSGTGGTIEKPRGRYLQISMELLTVDPLQSPKVHSLTVETAPHCAEDWTTRVEVLDQHNEAIVRSAIPFEYEPLDHPHLKTFRREYKLDEVVRGAKGELELMLRLAQWACNYWDWPNHIGDYYPPWDALEILKPYSDGKPTGGFCLQFNLVFLQACESFGFSGRMLSISQGRRQEACPGGGHEIVELWSNEYKKWVYVDGALAWYIVDDKTGIPLSMLELRDRQLRTLRKEAVEPVRVVAAERTKNKQFTWNGLGPVDPLNWYLELRMIPRSNFLQEKSPLPLNQGTEEWSWTGHYVWSDAENPAGLLFSHRVTKRNDFNWTLNQAYYVLEPAKKPGTFLVHLDTETPSFDVFLAEIDNSEKKTVPAVFTWKLHSGQNRLRVRPRNLSGREGIPSWIGLEYHPHF